MFVVSKLFKRWYAKVKKKLSFLSRTLESSIIVCNYFMAWIVFTNFNQNVQVLQIEKALCESNDWWWECRVCRGGSKVLTICQWGEDQRITNTLKKGVVKYVWVLWDRLSKNTNHKKLKLSYRNFKLLLWCPIQSVVKLLWKNKLQGE